MLKKAPTRLIAVEDSPLPEPDHGGTPTSGQGAAPALEMPESEVITRRIPKEDLAALEKMRRPRMGWPNWRSLVPAGVVAAVMSFFLVALAISTKITATSGHLGGSHASAEPPAPQPTGVPLAPAEPPPSRAAPEVIRMEIVADPAETELGIDGNVVAKGHLRLDVPRDRGAHLLTAAAAGYLPFNQRVSFSSDVSLTIKLHRGQVTPVRPATRARPPQVEVRRRVQGNPSTIHSTTRIEPGTALEAPLSRPKAMSIDEKNPYRP